MSPSIACRRSFLFAVSVAVLSGCGVNPRALEIAELTGVAANGASIYSQHCATCHGDDAKSGSAGRNLVTKSADLIGTADKVLGGGIIMPKYAETLTNQQIADLIANIAAR